ncbi:MAG: peroxiredoxin [Mycobacterium sp.]|nr:peroxiredoxin [Mycobacterium sp.]
MLGVGDRAPDFTLPDASGAPVTLTTLLAAGPVVLFFYPAAMTPGCTAEACHFRDLSAEFAAAGAQRLGISVDAMDKQQAFTDLHGFDFPLLSDAEGAVASAYGVKRRVGPLPVKRATFVIGADGVVSEVIHSELRMSLHADRALQALTPR